MNQICLWFFSIVGFGNCNFFSNYVEVTTPPPESIGATPKCGEEDQLGKFKCVPYYNCDPTTNTIAEIPEVDGSDSIQPRLLQSVDKKCGNFLEVCCQVYNASENSIPYIAEADRGFESTCGIKNRQSENPWLIKILKQNENQAFCGGSLISHGLVLTAAHCIIQTKPENIKIRAGNMQNVGQYQERNVTGFIIHQHYFGSAFYNDIALLILDKSVTKAANIQTICLPKLNKKFNTSDCTVTRISTLQQMKVIPASNENCQLKLRRKLGDEFILQRSFICGDGNKTCKGDGGAPLVCSNSGSNYQIGIVSWGLGCNESYTPDVYTNIVEMRDWIDFKVQEFGYSMGSYTTDNQKSLKTN